MAIIMGLLGNSPEAGIASGGNTLRAGQMEMHWEIVGE